jgi:hypothetical protein
MIESRKFPRIDIKIKIGYEFVKWNKYNLDQIKKPLYANSINLSSRGVRIDHVPELKSGLKHLLETGKKKIKSEIFIYPDKQPLITFTRLVWTDNGLSEKNSGNIECGLMFIDVSNEFFQKMEQFINSYLMKKQTDS